MMLKFARNQVRNYPFKLPLASIHTEAKLESLGIKLPVPPPPKGNYVPYVRTGNYLFLAGHLPQQMDGQLLCGKVGDSLSLEKGQEAARACGLNLIATIQNACDGNLDRVKRIVKLVGFVNCTNDFTSQPAVMNGCSDLMGEVFGDKGKHARSAVGTNALPLGIAVEVEAIVEIEP